MRVKRKSKKKKKIKLKRSLMMGLTIFVLNKVKLRRSKTLKDNADAYFCTSKIFTKTAADSPAPGHAAAESDDGTDANTGQRGKTTAANVTLQLSAHLKKVVLGKDVDTGGKDEGCVATKYSHLFARFLFLNIPLLKGRGENGWDRRWLANKMQQHRGIYDRRDAVHGKRRRHTGPCAQRVRPQKLAVHVNHLRRFNHVRNVVTCLKGILDAQALVLHPSIRFCLAEFCHAICVLN